NQRVTNETFIVYTPPESKGNDLQGSWDTPVRAAVTCRWDDVKFCQVAVWQLHQSFDMSQLVRRRRNHASLRVSRFHERNHGLIGNDNLLIEPVLEEIAN